MENFKIKVPTIEELLSDLIKLEEELDVLKSMEKKDEDLTEMQYYSLMFNPAKIKSLKWKIKNYPKYSERVLNTTILRDKGYENESKIAKRLNSLLKEN